MLALLLFSFSAAVCVNVFVQAKTLNTKSHELNQSVLLTQNAAECFQASRGDLYQMNGLLKGKTENNVLSVAYDSDWKTTEKENAVYLLTISLSNQSDNILLASVSMYKGDAVLYQLHAQTLKTSYTGGGL